MFGQVLVQKQLGAFLPDFYSNSLANSQLVCESQKMFPLVSVPYDSTLQSWSVDSLHEIQSLPKFIGIKVVMFFLAFT